MYMHSVCDSSIRFVLRLVRVLVDSSMYRSTQATGDADTSKQVHAVSTSGILSPTLFSDE